MDALYYPRLSLPSPSWTNPNLLFFDRIHVIAPSGGHRQLFDRRTRALMDHDVVRPINPSEFARDDAADEIVLGYLIGRSQGMRRRAELARIHFGKIAFSRLAVELERVGLLRRLPRDQIPRSEVDGSWMEGPAWVIEYLMSMLATRIVTQIDDLPLITDEENARLAVTGVRSAARNNNVRRLKAVTTLLPAGPDISLEDILRFREEHPEELANFRRFVTELTTRNSADEDFEYRLRAAEEVRNRLVARLEQVPSRLPAAEIVLSASALAAPLVEHSYYSAAAAALGLGHLLLRTAEQARQYRQVRRAVMQDKLVFAALAAKRFAPGWGDEVLR